LLDLSNHGGLIHIDLSATAPENRHELEKARSRGEPDGGPGKNNREHHTGKNSQYPEQQGIRPTR
jgi:hypothetical protein